MLRIKSINVRHVRSFSNALLKLPDDTQLLTLSGPNGAGKSTLIKAAWLVQKAHFLVGSLDSDEIQRHERELARYLNRDDSRISVTFSYRDEDTSDPEVEASIAISAAKEGGYTITYEREELIRQSWNPDNPKDIILYVDASKGFSEVTLSYADLNIARNNRAHVAMQAILRPEDLFSGIYQQLVRDYVHSRLVPSKPDRLLYLQVAKAMFAKLLPGVQVSNFSGKHHPDEFVLLGKAVRDGRSMPLYDVREFSSGEKALFGTLTFLCISRSVAVLAIDEPENHFHDSLLLEFVSLARTLTAANGIVSWAESYNAANEGKPKLPIDMVRSEYRGHRLRQIVLATHSRPLIYKTFSLGQNFTVDHGAVETITYEGAEESLRSLGLSTTISRLVLVEGASDSAALHYFMADSNVQVKPLNGADAVVETFKRLAQVAKYITDSQFVFLVDSDNKPADFFGKLRKVDPDFYDRSFIKLPVHEFENLLLDAPLFRRVMQRFSEIHGDEVPDVDSIHLKLVELAREAGPQTLAKELSNAMRMEILQHFGEQLWNKMGPDPAAETTSRLGRAFSPEETETLKSSLETIVEELTTSSNSLTDADVLRRCDGKIVLNRLLRPDVWIDE